MPRKIDPKPSDQKPTQRNLYFHYKQHNIVKLMPSAGRSKKLTPCCRSAIAPCFPDEYSHIGPNSICYLNIRSLLPKCTELNHLTSKLRPAVIAVSETWLNPSIPDGAFLPQGYVSASRTDRTGRRGGGVTIMCRSDICFKERSDLCCWNECCWIETKLS